MLWTAFILIYFLLGGLSSFGYFNQKLNFTKQESLILPLLYILLIEDIFFIIKRNKYSQYYKTDNNRSWYIRYFLMITQLIPILLPIQIICNERQLEYLFIILPLLSTIYICYMVTYFIILRIEEIMHLQGIIDYKKIFITFIQAIVLCGISNQFEQSKKNIWLGYLIIGYVIVFSQIIIIYQRFNNRILGTYQIIAMIKIIFGINTDISQNQFKQFAKKMRVYTLDLEFQFQIYFLFSSVLLPILYIIQVQSTDLSLSDPAVQIWFVLLFLHFISHLYLMFKNILPYLIKGSKLIFIRDSRSMTQLVQNFNQQQYKNVEIIILNIRLTQQQDISAVQNYLFFDLKGLQIVDLQNQYYRKDKNNSNVFQKIKMIEQFNLETFQDSLNQRQIHSQIRQIKFSLLDDNTYINLINLLIQRDLLIRVKCQRQLPAFFNNNATRAQIQDLHEKFLTMYQNVAIVQNIIFQKELSSFIPINPRLVQYDLYSD